MKLTETVMIRNYLQILKENEEAVFDKEQMETIKDIASKHYSSISYTQMLGIMDKEIGANIEEDELNRFVEELKNNEVGYKDDRKTADGVINELGDFSENNLSKKAKNIYKKIMSKKLINRDIVSKTLLKGFKTREINADEWQMMMINIKSSDDTVGAHSSPIKKALEDVGIQVDDSGVIKRFGTQMGRSGKQRPRALQTSGDKMPETDATKGSPTSIIEKQLRDSVNKNATKEEQDEVKEVIGNLFRKRASNIAHVIAKLNDIRKDQGKEMIEIQQIIDNSFIKLDPKLKLEIIEGISEYPDSNIKDHVTIVGGIPTWLEIEPQEAKILQMNVDASNHVLGRSFGMFGIGAPGWLR